MDELALTELLITELMKEYGPVLSGENLSLCLGFRTRNAFRKALSRNQVPVVIFDLPNRSGKYALTVDVAKWLAMQRINAQKEKEMC